MPSFQGRAGGGSRRSGKDINPSRVGSAGAAFREQPQGSTGHLGKTPACGASRFGLHPADEQTPTHGARRFEGPVLHFLRGRVQPSLGRQSWHIGPAARSAADAGLARARPRFSLGPGPCKYCADRRANLGHCASQ